MDKTCVDVYGILPKSFKNYLESENFVCGAVAGTKTTLGIMLWL